MAHPEQLSVHDRVAQAIQKERAAGRKFNACPCGCTDQMLNQHGYCRHLIGWTNDKKWYEARQRVTRTGLDGKPDGSPYERVGAMEPDPEGEPFLDDEGRKILPLRPVLHEVLPTDILIASGGSWRVYRGQQVRDVVSDVPSLESLIKKVEYLGNQVATLAKENQDLKSKQTELEDAATKPAVVNAG